MILFKEAGLCAAIWGSEEAGDMLLPSLQGYEALLGAFWRSHVAVLRKWGDLSPWSKQEAYGVGEVKLERAGLA